MIGKPGCHLCDDARAVIERVAREEGVEWEELNMLDDPELVARYAEQIPVTLVDGRQHDYWRVDENRLRKALSAPPRGA
ncbi:MULTISPECIES: glutaredoxin family protein [Dermacoccus]|uniref:glutaredoxin family protein n=1 Tax=Dermacoccus TaxID=57495 RepID=UPI001CECBAE7|nr:MULTISPECIES: glutaredoxin family protein [Dermacoccus]